MPNTLTYNSAVILPFSSVNISAQVGDMIYYISEPIIAWHDIPWSTENNIRFLGEITNIDTAVTGGSTVGWNTVTNVTVIYNNNETSLPPIGAFILFAKNKQVNTSSLLGYYASVNFVNSSIDKVELFSIGSEISESSK
jgi:hypothetical protein